MKLKHNKVNIDGLNPCMFDKLEGIENICKSVIGNKYEMTITSAKDGYHSNGSKHYIGDAIDIRTFDMGGEKNVDKVCNILSYMLGENYDVVNEYDHIHIEYDIKIEKGGKK